MRASLPLALLLLLAGCTATPPEQVADVCGIFYEKPGWYRDAARAEKRWGIPVAVLMAFTHQESSYKAKSRPPRERLLWVIPWRRPSSAYGYAQATSEAWSDYKHDTGRYRADRDDFGDAMDFVGWYNRRSADVLGIARNDAYRLYLAYHEGTTGYRRGTFRSKDWLVAVARKVDTRARTYQSQLAGCEDDLDDPWWWPF